MDAGRSPPDWFPDWSGECVAIVAAGPSVKQDEVNKLRDRIHVIAINESYKLCRWADALYSCDKMWWDLNKGAKDFSGLKITQCDQAVKVYPDIKKINIRRTQNNVVHEFLMDKAGEVGGGGNGGYQMLNLAVQFGATAVALLGFDCCSPDIQKPHWHGRHPSPLNNPIQTNFVTWRTHLDNAAAKLAQLNVDVVNCSPISTVSKYPRLTVDDALKRWTL